MKLNEVLKDCVNNKKPLAVGKIGSERLSAMQSYMTNGNKSVSAKLFKNTGVFPQNAKCGFFEEYSKALKGLDYVRVSFGNIGPTHVPGKRIDNEENRIFVPFMIANPWTRELKGKTVLVISPFSKTIESQMKIKDKIWGNKLEDMLPCDVKTIKAPLSFGICNNEERKREFEDRETWIEACEHMKTQMNNTDFDVLIVGAGGYGIPLAYHAKTLGKIGVDFGGAAQLMFGVKGGRWKRTDYNNLFNDHWVFPSDEETPSGCRQVEAGCYWK